MALDVIRRRVIPLPVEQVATYAMDWRNSPAWTHHVRQSELTRPAPGGGFGVGSQIKLVTYARGRRGEQLMEVVEYRPPTELRLRSVEGPASIEITYRFDPHPRGTLASIQVRGDGAASYRLAGPLMTLLVGWDLTRDLRNLQRRLTV